jgi:hypothetical protein
MLPRELVEEFLGRCGAAGFHVLEALTDTLHSFLIVLPLPFEVIGKGIIESVSGALPAPTGEFLELRQALAFHR